MAEGKLTEKKKRELKETFDLFDKDGDQGISMKEMATVMRANGYSPTEEAVKSVWNKSGLDKDKDAKISFDEFVQMMDNYKICEGKDLTDSFKLFDTDGNGYLSKEEVQAIVSQLGEPLTEAELAEFMDEVDIDKDGKINYIEFVKLMCDEDEQ